MAGARSTAGARRGQDSELARWVGGRRGSAVAILTLPDQAPVVYCGNGRGEETGQPTQNCRTRLQKYDTWRPLTTGEGRQTAARLARGSRLPWPHRLATAASHYPRVRAPALLCPLGWGTAAAPLASRRLGYEGVVLSVEFLTVTDGGPELEEPTSNGNILDMILR